MELIQQRALRDMRSDVDRASNVFGKACGTAYQLIHLGVISNTPAASRHRAILFKSPKSNEPPIYLEERLNGLEEVHKSGNYTSMNDITREIHGLVALSASNMFAAFKGGYFDGRVMGVMTQFFPRGTLKDFIDQVRKSFGTGLSDDMWRQLLIELIRAIKYMEEHHLYHSDMKDFNIVLSLEPPFFRIIDFGSRQLGKKDELLCGESGTAKYQYPPITSGHGKYKYLGMTNELHAVGKILLRAVVPNDVWEFWVQRSKVLTHEGKSHKGMFAEADESHRPQASEFQEEVICSLLDGNRQEVDVHYHTVAAIPVNEASIIRSISEHTETLKSTNIPSFTVAEKLPGQTAFLMSMQQKITPSMPVDDYLDRVKRCDVSLLECFAEGQLTGLDRRRFGFIFDVLSGRRTEVPHEDANGGPAAHVEAQLRTEIAKLDLELEQAANDWKKTLQDAKQMHAEQLSELEHELERLRAENAQLRYSSSANSHPSTNYRPDCRWVVAHSSQAGNDTEHGKQAATSTNAVNQQRDTTTKPPTQEVPEAALTSGQIADDDGDNMTNHNDVEPNLLGGSSKGGCTADITRAKSQHPSNKDDDKRSRTKSSSNPLLPPSSTSGKESAASTKQSVPTPPTVSNSLTLLEAHAGPTGTIRMLRFTKPGAIYMWKRSAMFVEQGLMTEAQLRNLRIFFVAAVLSMWSSKNYTGNGRKMLAYMTILRGTVCPTRTNKFEKALTALAQAKKLCWADVTRVAKLADKKFTNDDFSLKDIINNEVRDLCHPEEENASDEKDDDAEIDDADADTDADVESDSKDLQLKKLDTKPLRKSSRRTRTKKRQDDSEDDSDDFDFTEAHC